MTRTAAITGVAEVDPRNPLGRTVLQLQAEAAVAALRDAGLTTRDVDGIAVAGDWHGPRRSMVMAEYLGITEPRFTDSTDVGGASFEAHLGHAADAIGAGRCEVVLILYGSTQRSQRSRDLGGREPVLFDQYEQPYGLPKPVGAYALAAMRHQHEFGTTRAQLAEVAVAARAWARLHPTAIRREPLTIDDVLAAPPICEPLGRHDCCLVTDGAGAVVVVSAARARDLRRPPVWLLGQGASHTHESIANMPSLTSTAAVRAGRDAFARAGVRHGDIDVALVYDSFTITVLLTLEALGFCAPGEGGPFVAGQRTAPAGDFPMNTNGGGLAHSHPGMYGIFLLIEAVHQLRGEAGERQVPDARIAIAAGVGGVLGSAAVAILGRD